LLVLEPFTVELWLGHKRLNHGIWLNCQHC
jgi:hypothetical protein